MNWNVKQDVSVTKTIWKHQLGQMTSSVNIPSGSKALKIDIDPKDGSIYLWYLCDPTKEKKNYRITYFGTGWDINSDTLIGMKFFNTIITKGGFVWHYFIEDSL